MVVFLGKQVFVNSKYFSLPIIFILGGLLATSQAKTRGNLKKNSSLLWNEIEIEFKAKDFESIHKRLNNMENWNPKSKSYDAALVVLIDSEIRLGNYDYASSLVNYFNVAIRNPEYLPRVLYYEGLLSGNKNNYFDAALKYSQVVNTSSSESLFNKAKSELLKLSRAKLLSESELQSIIEILKYDDELISSVLFDLGEIQTMSRRYKAAVITYEMWLHYFYGGKLTSRVKSNLRKVRKKEVPHKTILIMLPITGGYQDIGKVLSQGILPVIENYLKKEDSNLNYKILDTEGDPIKAVKKMRRKIQEDNIIAILGPAMSDVSIAVSVELSSKSSNVPMITPTATTEGISALGSGIFQVNVATHSLGEKISRYALECLNLFEFAILAPNTEYGLGLASSFENTVKKTGGKIIATEYYDSGVKDYSRHFKVIRHRKANAELIKKWKVSRDEFHTIPKRERSSWYADSVLNIDGLFIAASNGDDAYKLSSQARFHKINSQILGSSGWYDKNLLHRGMRDLKGVVFSLDFVNNPDSDTWKSFSELYHSRWGEVPNKVASLGHDASLFLVQGLKMAKGDALIESLLKIHKIHGSRGDILMHPVYGYNQSTTLMEFGRKDFKEVKACFEM